MCQGDVFGFGAREGDDWLFLSTPGNDTLPNEKGEAQDKMSVKVGCPVGIRKSDDVMRFAPEDKFEMFRT